MKSDVKGMSSQSGEDQNTDSPGDKKHFALFWFVTAVLRSVTWMLCIRKGMK